MSYDRSSVETMDYPTNNVEFNTSNYQEINSECACFNLRKITRAVTQFFDRQLETIGIRSTQFTLLVELGSVSAKTLTEIANGLVMDRTTLTRNLKPLEKMGLISTVQPADKRAKVYVLTNAGKEILQKGLPIWQLTQQQIVDYVGQDRYSGLLNELNHLLKAVPESIRS